MKLFRQALTVLTNGVLAFLLLFVLGEAFLLAFVFSRPPSLLETRPSDPALSEANRGDAVTLLFVGDIMLARRIGEILASEQDWSYPFRLTASSTRSADIAFANLEGPIAGSGENVGSMYSFRADPRSVVGLTYAGFDVLSIANNHIWDYGPDAFMETIHTLQENGISPIGGGLDYDQAHLALIRDVRGTRIAFLAYTKFSPNSRTGPDAEPATAFPDIADLVSDIQLARLRSDVVVVSFHWGDEYVVTHTADQQSLAHAAIDAGANLIIGHHPHVVQDTEFYKGAFIAYSLGNFVFDQNFSEETKSGMMLGVTVEGKKVSEIEEIPIRFSDTFQPYRETP